MNEQLATGLTDAFLAASLPIDSSSLNESASRVFDFYRNAPAKVTVPDEEVADRFEEMWRLWFEGDNAPSKELRDVVREAVGADPKMGRLGHEYFGIETKLEDMYFMSRTNAIALVGCAPLIRALVEEQHLGLDRIKSILNVPGTTYDTIASVLSAIGIAPSFTTGSIPEIHAADVNDVAALFGDIKPDEAEGAFRGLLGSFSRDNELWECVTELVYIPFEPYHFMLYYELLTLETTDRFPGQAIYEFNPRNDEVKRVWNKMYHPTQQNPYLNNAKSVFSLDIAWAETKVKKQKHVGSLLLANIFEIMAELPYTTRRRVAHVIRCYLVLTATKNQVVTPLPPADDKAIKSFVSRVAAANSMTKGVLDQRLVDFLTMCIHGHDDWAVFGLGSSVNESNASGRKYGDVEYLDLDTRKQIHAYEAHGGSLRDEYVASHINSLHGTVAYHKSVAKGNGESYEREVGITYVAHDISRLERFVTGYAEDIDGIPFVFRFITFGDLVIDAGGIDEVSKKAELFRELVHERISRLPDAYSLKKQYRNILDM